MRLYQDGGRSVVGGAGGACGAGAGAGGVGVGAGVVVVVVVVVASLQHLNHELICVTGNVKYRTTSAS